MVKLARAYQKHFIKHHQTANGRPEPGQLPLNHLLHMNLLSVILADSQFINDINLWSVILKSAPLPPNSSFIRDDTACSTPTIGASIEPLYFGEVFNSHPHPIHSEHIWKISSNDQCANHHHFGWSRSC